MLSTSRELGLAASPSGPACAGTWSVNISGLSWTWSPNRFEIALTAMVAPHWRRSLSLALTETGERQVPTCWLSTETGPHSGPLSLHGVSRPTGEPRTYMRCFPYRRVFAYLGGESPSAPKQEAGATPTNREKRCDCA